MDMMVFFLFSMLQAFIYGAVFATLAKIRPNVILVVVLAVLSTVSVIITNTIPALLANFMMILANLIYVAIFAVVLHKRVKILHLSLFYGVVAVILVLLGGSFTTLVLRIFGVVTGFDARDYVTGILHFVAAAVTNLVVSVGLAYLAGRALEKRLSLLDESIKKKFAKYLFVGASINLFLFFYHFFVPFMNLDYTVNEFISFSFITAYFVFLVFAVFTFVQTMQKQTEEKLNAALHAQEKKAYVTQCRLMQESSGRVRANRHDMKLHMVALKGFVSENKNANALDYINNFLGGIGESELHSTTGNTALDSIINYKLKDINKSQINLNLKVPAVIGIDDSDIITIIGNLIDNALEAVAKVDEKTITLNVTQDKGTLLIKCENPYNGELKENYASLKDGENHGHGLNNIKRSVEKYDGYMKICPENNVFSVNIMLYER